MNKSRIVRNSDDFTVFYKKVYLDHLMVIQKLLIWQYSKFHILCNNCILPKNITAMASVECYIIRASSGQEHMQYLDQEGKVVYMSRGDSTSKRFPALEQLANLYSNILNRGY